MNRISAKCGDCGMKFQADERMLEAGDFVAVAAMVEGVTRVGVVCPGCTSTHIEKA